MVVPPRAFVQNSKFIHSFGLVWSYIQVEEIAVRLTASMRVIQEQIVSYYLNSYNMIATQAALMGGFAFGGYSFHDNTWLEHDH